MATIVLVHGAFQNSTCWSRLETRLAAAGQKVATINLPGCDGDSIDPHKITTEDYKDAVLAALAKIQQAVVLVGHSFGGITVSNVAEAVPLELEFFHRWSWVDSI